MIEQAYPNAFRVDSPGGREYFKEKNGRPYVSVTTFIGAVLRQPQLERWRGKVGNEEADRVRDEAAQLGTMIHEACAEMIVNKEDAYKRLSSEHQRWVEGYIIWHSQNVEEVLSVEEFIFNDRYGYAGAADEIAVMKGDTTPSVLDIKTGIITKAAKLQTIAYMKGDGITAKRRIIIGIDKKNDGKISIHEHTNHSGDWTSCQYALGLYWWNKRS